MSASSPRHFLDLLELSTRANCARILDARPRRQGARARARDAARPLAGKMLAMIFDKPSTRTRVSFDVGMRQLGGESIMLTGAEMQLGRGETIADTARVLSRYVDAIMIRILDHDDMLEMARARHGAGDQRPDQRSRIPARCMADIMTFEEHRGPDRGQHDRLVGDGNNVLPSWIHASARFGFTARDRLPGRNCSPASSALDWAEGDGRATSRSTRRPGRGGDGRRLRSSPIAGCRWATRTRAGATTCCALSGQRQADEPCRAGRDLHALPAGPSRRGGDGRGDRRAAIGGLRRGREPPPRAERRCWPGVSGAAP